MTRRILLTRPRAQSEETARALAADGWEALIWPLTEIRPACAPPDLGGAQAALFTSARGVEALAAPPPPIPALCVGPATAAAARTAGFFVVIDAAGDAADLAREAAARLDPEGGPVIHVRGANASGDLAGLLRRGGFTVEEAIVYQAAAAGPPDDAVDQAVRAGEVGVAAFYSPRASRRFSEAAPARWRPALGAMTAVAISAAAVKPLASAGFSGIMIAARPDGAAMRAAIHEAAQ